MAKHKEVARTRMSEEQADKFLKKFLADHDLKGKEAEHYIRRVAATRLAALHRYAAAHKAKPAGKAKGKGKKEAKKAA